MAELFELNPEYSTTRLVTRETPTIEEPPDAAFNTVLFLPKGDGRKGEGGLRTQGYFKRSLPGKPLITVITVVFNGAQHLEKTILSVIGQTYDNVEYIIIDGDSTDGTLDIICKYEHAIDYWVSEKDEGIYDAWNKGVKASNGTWIAFLGSGDIYFSMALVNYSHVLNNQKQIQYISSKVFLLKNNKTIRTIGAHWNWNNFQKKMTVAHVGSLHAINLFKKIGLFDTTLKIAGDYEFILRFKDKLKALYVNEVTAAMQTGGKSDSSFEVFKETVLIKTKYTERYSFVIRLEMIYSYIKWLIRKTLWY